MKVLRVRNVNEALPVGLRLLRDEGERRDSRNGFAMVATEPVTTVYQRPLERVIFDATRDANPFLHLFEALWMLAGRSDLAYVKNFAKNMANFSDDGTTLWGAYGWRWRSFFGLDQLQWVVDRLKNDSKDRRVVLQMWSGEHDPGVASNNGKDVPCNLAAHFQVNSEGQLDMTVFNRSNDIIWGAYGANVVHFSILQEYVAGCVGVPIGRYWQVSDNYHAYSDLYTKLVDLADEADFPEDPYANGVVTTMPLMTGNCQKTWDEDLAMFLDEPMAVGFRNAFFRKIAKPMMATHMAFKAKDWDAAFAALDQMPNENDWACAAWEWLERRKEKTNDD